jgi:aspartyl-tRNA(Asn)/glutamyl-tRNA(Gln) amidotransferase subunit B
MELALFFEATLVETNSKQPVKIANYLIGQVAGYLNENKTSLAQTKLTPKLLAEMVLAIDQGIISDNIAKNDIILELLTKGTSVKELIETKGLAQITDTGAIEAIVKKIIETNQKQLAEYKAGNAKLKGFFVGQVMKETQGKASPQIINDLLEKFLA